MAKKDCPLCEGKKTYLVANTNIKIDCEFCDDRGEIPRPENYDETKDAPGMLSRIAGLFRSDE